MFKFILTISTNAFVVKRYAFATFENLMAYLAAQESDDIRFVSIEPSNIIVIEG